MTTVYTGRMAGTKEGDASVHAFKKILIKRIFSQVDSMAYSSLCPDSGLRTTTKIRQHPQQEAASRSGCPHHRACYSGNLSTGHPASGEHCATSTRKLLPSTAEEPSVAPSSVFNAILEKYPYCSTSFIHS